MDFMSFRLIWYLIDRLNVKTKSSRRLNQKSGFRPFSALRSRLKPSSTDACQKRILRCREQW